MKDRISYALELALQADSPSVFTIHENDRSSVPKTSANIQKVKQLPASSSITPVLALCGKPPRSSTLSPSFPCEEQKGAKTYNSGDSLVVTHLTTNPPVHCLYMAERTGSLIFSVLWSYVEETENGTNIMLQPSSLYLDLQFKNYHHTSHNKVRP